MRGLSPDTSAPLRRGQKLDSGWVLITLIFKMKGWIYIVGCEAAPKFTKIGFSLREPQLRLVELDTTGVPGKLFLACSYLVSEAESVESFIHLSLAKYHSRKEWFSLEVMNAIGLVDRILEGRILYRESTIKQGNVKPDGRPIPPGCEHQYLSAFRKKYTLKYKEVEEVSNPIRFSGSPEIIKKYIECQAVGPFGETQSVKIEIDYERASRLYHESIYQGNARAEAQDAAELALLRKLTRI